MSACICKSGVNAAFTVAKKEALKAALPPTPLLPYPSQLRRRLRRQPSPPSPLLGVGKQYIKDAAWLIPEDPFIDTKQTTSMDQLEGISFKGMA